LTRVYEQDFCSAFNCKEFHLLVDKCHRRSNHFAVLKQESHNISRRAI
jgi:hypothetical protein